MQEKTTEGSAEVAPVLTVPAIHHGKGNVWRQLRKRTGESGRQFRRHLKALRRAQREQAYGR